VTGSGASLFWFRDFSRPCSQANFPPVLRRAAVAAVRGGRIRLRRSRNAAALAERGRRQETHFGSIDQAVDGRSTGFIAHTVFTRNLLISFSYLAIAAPTSDAEAVFADLICSMSRSKLSKRRVEASFRHGSTSRVFSKIKSCHRVVRKLRELRGAYAPCSERAALRIWTKPNGGRRRGAPTSAHFCSASAAFWNQRRDSAKFIGMHVPCS